MKQLLSLICISVFLITDVNAQSVGINYNGAAPNSASALDIDVSAASPKKGLLIPRVTFSTRTVSMATLSVPAQGLLVYQTDGAEGFYYNTSLTTTPNWIYLAGNNNWSLTGNAGIVDGTNFIGPTNSVPFSIMIGGVKAGRIDNILANSFWGYNAGQSTTGGNNSAFGAGALYSNTVGGNNVAIGWSSLASNIGGSNAVAIGYNAMRYTGGQAGTFISWNVAIGDGAMLGSATPANNTGIQNVAIGGESMYSLISGSFNTATGQNSLYANTAGNDNTANGHMAMQSNTTAGENVGVGYHALYTQSYSNGGVAWASNNTAIGSGALFSNQPTSTVNGINNTGTGYGSLYSNTIGINNTANGYRSLYSNSTAGFNTAIGYQALFTQSYNNGGAPYLTHNTAIGANTLYNNQPVSATTGIYNTAVGSSSLFVNTTGSNNTATGLEALLSNTIGNYNTANGVSALNSNSSASDNVAVGYQALYTQSYSNGGSAWSSYNTAIGNYALFSNQPTSNGNGIDNTAVGYNALYANTVAIKNTAIGFAAMNDNTVGGYNTAVGMNALANNTAGAENTAVGYQALHAQSFLNGGVEYSTGNVAIGNFALYNNQPTLSTNGVNNTAVGSNALSTNVTGYNNTVIGALADVTANNLTNATAIGYKAKVAASNSLVLGGIGADAVNVGIGIPVPIFKLDVSDRIRLRQGVNSAGLWLYQTAPGNDRSFIGMEDDNHVGLYGNTGAGWGMVMDIANGFIGMGTVSPVEKLHVAGNIRVIGNICYTGTLGTCSDIRYKKNITPLQNSLTNLLKLQGVSYNWKTNEFPDKHFTDQKQIGVIAQELEKIYPELVMTDKDGYKSVDYSKITPVLIEAIKDLNTKVDNLQKELKNANEANKKIEALTERLNKLEGQPVQTNGAAIQ
jgi:trimeric autotransporter adhesin